MFKQIALPLLAALATARAGVISLIDLPATGTDAASGISGTNIYLCALDFGSLTTAVSVNGVSFQQLSLSGAGSGADNKHPLFNGTDANFGGNWTLAADFSDGSAGLAGTSNSGATSQADGSMRSMLSDLTYLSGGGIAVGDTATLTLGYLSPGANYSLRYYYRQWNTTGTFPRRPINFLFNGEGADQSYSGNPLDLDAGGAHYIQYDFTAASNSVSAQFITELAKNGPHIYAVTLQQTSPVLKPSLVFSPQGFTNNVETSAALTVGVSGSPPLTYQWFKNAAAISGANNAALNFNWLNLADSGAYQVIVTNIAGAVTSSVANVLVVDAPKPPLEPLDAALLAATATANSLIVAADANQATTNWTAHWIGPATSFANEWLCYRKSFSLSSQPTQAIARIAADTKYWLWVNGQIAVREGGLKRGPTTDDTWYDEVDLAPLLQSGSNTIALLHWYFGKDGFSHNSSGTAGMIFEMSAAGAVIKTDTTWRMITNTAFKSATVVAQPNYRLPETSLRYDAQLDLGAWTNAAFNDSAWAAPTDRGTVGGAPFGTLWRRPLPLWKDTALLDFTTTNVSGTLWTGHIPVNVRFTPWLDVDAPAGQVITIKTDANGGGTTPLSHEYATRAGRQSFEFPAWLNGQEARFNVPAGITVYGLKYRPHQSDTDIIGSFNCDDASLVTLWNKAANTLVVNMIDTWSDCPDRERANWIGDATVDLGQTPYVFDARAELTTRKSLLDVIHWQRPDQTMFAPAPAGNWSSELPVQILAAIGKYGALRYFQNTGDTNFLAQAYPASRDYLLNVWQTNAQGLVIHRAGGWDWSDWGNNIDSNLLDNTWYLMACEAAAEIAPLVGQSADAAAFTSRAQGIRASFNAAFWTGTEYRSSGYSGSTDERGNAMAVLAGLPDASMTSALRTVLTTRINASPYMEKYVLEALFALGFPDDSLARMRSRYGTMISNSATTLWELFPASGTFNHAWSGGPLTLLAEKVAGVTPTSPGFATFDVQPVLGTTLNDIDLDVPSRHGVIRIAISRIGANNKVSVRAPVGATGRLIQPAGGALAGAILSIPGGVTATLDETVSPAEINVTNGTATLASSFTSNGKISKTGAGTLDFGTASLATAGFNVIQGVVRLSSGSALTVSGNMTNQGTLQLTGTAQLNVIGNFVNQSLLDIINWNGTLPNGFINTGIVLDRSSVRIEACGFVGRDFNITIKGYPDHVYRLQSSSRLNPAAWVYLGSPQAGSAGILSFTDTNALAKQGGFYRVEVDP